MTITNAVRVLTINTRTGNPVIYQSMSAASRVLSGNGDSDNLRRQISRRCENGGGYIGDVWVQFTALPAVKKS